MALNRVARSRAWGDITRQKLRNLPVEKASAYRFAGITLAIVTLVARGEAPFVIALHRFVEVSIGIAVALALSALWPELERTLSVLINETYVLTPVEIAPMWQTAPPRMPIPPPAV